MFKCSGIGVFLGALLSFILLQAAPSSNGLDQHLNKVHKEAAHPWINQLTVDPELEQPKDGVDGDVWYLLADFQTHAEKQQNYYHNAYRFLNPEGVGEDSQLTLNFHPSYQDLYLHKIVVHRQGKAQNRLPDCEVKLLNHESGIERQLYNGSISAHLILKDIQVGDVLEYAYSIQGRNPVFKDRFAQYINLSYATHVHRIHRRFLWNPQKRTLRHKIFCSDKDYQATIGDDEAELLIDEIDAPIVTYEDGVPVWHFARPFIQVSDYESWEQFSHWAHSCFELDQELPDELGDVLKDLKAIENPSEQIVSALNYVQEQYRYLGSFMGSHTHRAYPLNLISSR